MVSSFIWQYVCLAASAGTRELSSVLPVSSFLYILILGCDWTTLGTGTSRVLLSVFGICLSLRRNSLNFCILCHLKCRSVRLDPKDDTVFC